MPISQRNLDCVDFSVCYKGSMQGYIYNMFFCHYVSSGISLYFDEPLKGRFYHLEEQMKEHGSQDTEQV